MKKIGVLLSLALYTSIYCDELTNFWYDVNPELLSPLSQTEQLQLQYLFDELKKYHQEAETEWIFNQNIENLLEIMELAVLQAPAKTQEFFKLKIIHIFQQFNINVYFTNDGLIEKKIQNILIPTYQSNLHKKTSKKLNFHHKSSGKPIKTQSKKPAKIKGANRTRKKLEKAWQERKDAAKRAADLAQEKRNTKKASVERPTPADHVAQTIWDREMARHHQRWQSNSESPDLEEENQKILGEL